jgi:hypothetical protein
MPCSRSSRACLGTLSLTCLERIFASSDGMLNRSKAYQRDGFRSLNHQLEVLFIRDLGRNKHRAISSMTSPLKSATTAPGYLSTSRQSPTNLRVPRQRRSPDASRRPSLLLSMCLALSTVGRCCDHPLDTLPLRRVPGVVPVPRAA